MRGGAEIGILGLPTTIAASRLLGISTTTTSTDRSL